MELLLIILIVILTSIVVLKISGAFKQGTTANKVITHASDGLVLRIATSNEEYLRDSELTIEQITTNKSLKQALLGGTK